MNLTDKIRDIARRAKEVRESFTFDPRTVDPKTAASHIREGLQGYSRIGGLKGTPQYEAKFAEALTFVTDVLQGRRPHWQLKEAMTTSDFVHLMGDMMYRQMLGHFAAYPTTWEQWCRRRVVRDFRTLNMMTLDGGQDILAEVGEKEPYPETSFTDGKYTLSVKKYGRRYGISWELTVNDDLNAFAERPMMMAVGARRSEEKLATQQLVGATGPHTGFFTVGNANKVTGNAVLSIDGLRIAYQVLKAQLDTDGQPIQINMAILMVPPALEITALNILNALVIRSTVHGGATNQELEMVNWMKSKLKLVVNPYIPIVASSANGNTSWFLIADPSDPMNRPAVNFGLLQGHEQPQIFQKASDSIQIGGGGSDFPGSFENDTIDYKLRHIFGAAQCEPKAAVGSNGSGA